MFEEDFARIRAISQEMGCFSWTSLKYQDDILQYLIENRDRGHGVIEVGCYKGGLSALLAHVCKQFKWPFYTIDVDRTAVQSTDELLTVLGLRDCASIHLGTLSSFVKETTLKRAPALIVLDGDHRYDAVVEDIADTYRLNHRPISAVFHDYSLRHPTSDEKVDEAVRDSFGDWPVRHIGAQMVGQEEYPTKEKPAEDGHWWQVPGSEGAIVELPPRINKISSKKAAQSQPRSFLTRLIGRLHVR
jgi:hypothetical protein